MTSLAEAEDVRTEALAGPTFRGWRLRWWAEALLAVVGYELYGFVQGATNNERVLALRHGRDIISFEKWSHIWVEPAMNAWIATHRLLAEAANYYYELSHVMVTAAVLIWLWRRHPAAYTRWRNALLGMSAVALIVFWSFPVAPPRMAAPLTDTLVRYDTLGAAHAGGLVDLYAALPSLHVAWAAWVGAAVLMNVRRRVGALALLYPAMTSLVVLTTANHYVTDIVAGALLSLAFVVIAARRRPRTAHPSSRLR